MGGPGARDVAFPPPCARHHPLVPGRRGLGVVTRQVDTLGSVCLFCGRSYCRFDGMVIIPSTLTPSGAKRPPRNSPPGSGV